MLDNMKGGNLIKVVELKAAAAGDIEANMKKGRLRLRKGRFGRSVLHSVDVRS